MTMGIHGQGQGRVPAVETANRENRRRRKVFFLRPKERGFMGVERVVFNDHANGTT